MLGIIKEIGFNIKKSLKKIDLCFKARSKKYTHLYIGTPTHGNLGDQQIRVSTIEMLNDLKIKFIEIDMSEYFLYQDINFKNIKTIILHGGGNIGDEYMDDVLIRDHAIRKFKDKKIIIFPQTIYFKDNNSSELQISKKIYESHQNLTIALREKTSFQFAKNNFNCNMILTPDIVMYSSYIKNYQRKNVLMLLRHDIEKTSNDEDIKKIITSFENMGKKVIISDTVVNDTKKKTKRNYQIRRVLKSIASSEIVITDRLHGMIFCAITQTPCIVLSNYNHKIKDSYEWLKHLDYIYFAGSGENLEIEKLAVKLTNGKSRWKPLKEEFKKLIDGILKYNEDW